MTLFWVGDHFKQLLRIRMDLLKKTWKNAQNNDNSDNQKQTNVKHIFTPHGDLRGTKQTIGINKNRSKGYFTSMRTDL